MTIGAYYIYATIRDNNRRAFDSLSQNLLSQKKTENGSSEKDLYDYVRKHVSEYRCLPSPQTMEKTTFGFVSPPEPAAFYMDQIIKRAAHNNTVTYINTLSRRVKEGSIDLSDIRELTNSFRNELSSSAIGGAAKTASEVGKDIQYDLAERKRGVPQRHYNLGWPTLDAAIDGIMGGDLIVFFARPGVGKSNLIINAAHNIWKQGAKSLVISMEMTELQISSRLLALVGGFNPRNIRRGVPSPEVEDKLQMAIDELSVGFTPIITDGSVCRSTSDVEDLIDAASPDVVFIDAAYLLGAASRKAAWEQIQENMKELKKIAVKRNVPIIISVQMNRDGKKAKEVSGEHVAGADAILQLASVLISIEEADKPLHNVRRVLKILKNREGPCVQATIHSLFDPPNFEEISVSQQVHDMDSEEIIL